MKKLVHSSLFIVHCKKKTIYHEPFTINYKGFTLVEILVALGIVAFLAGLSLTFLFQTFFGGAKTAITIETKQAGERVLSHIEKKIFVARKAQFPLNQLVLEYRDGSQVTYKCKLPTLTTNGTIQFSLTGSGGPFIDLTNTDPKTGVNVINCNFGEISPLPNQTIEVTFTVKESVQAPNRSYLKAKGTGGVDFKQTFSLRNIT